MKLGRWEARDGSEYKVLGHSPGRFYPWLGEADWETWSDTGHYGSATGPNDLVRYLGPLELSPSIACAEAGAAGDPQTVSTRDPQESLRRMRAQHSALAREEAAYGELLAGIRRAKDDLEEAIKMLEKGVEG